MTDPLDDEIGDPQGALSHDKSSKFLRAAIKNGRKFRQRADELPKWRRQLRAIRGHLAGRVK